MEQGKPGQPGAGSSEGVLANFFNSLLSKKTGGQGVSPGGPQGSHIKSPGTNEDCK